MRAGARRGHLHLRDVLLELLDAMLRVDRADRQAADLGVVGALRSASAVFFAARARASRPARRARLACASTDATRSAGASVLSERLAQPRLGLGDLELVVAARERGIVALLARASSARRPPRSSCSRGRASAPTHRTDMIGSPAFTSMPSGARFAILKSQIAGQRRRLDVGRVDRLELAARPRRRRRGRLARRRRTDASFALCAHPHERDREQPLHEPPPITTTSPSASPPSTTQTCASHAPSLTSRDSPPAAERARLVEHDRAARRPRARL